MVDYEERVRPSIKRAVALLEEISDLPDGQWDVSVYKKALLCRMELQYSIAVLKLATGFDSRRAVSSSTDPNAVLQNLKHTLEEPISERTLERLYQADLLLSRKILQIRRNLKARPKQP